MILENNENPIENSLMIDFTTIIDLPDGSKKEFELIPNGKGTMVTDSNKRFFVERFLNFFLKEQCSTQLQEFKRGFM